VKINFMAIIFIAMALFNFVHSFFVDFVIAIALGVLAWFQIHHPEHFEEQQEHHENHDVEEPVAQESLEEESAALPHVSHTVDEAEREAAKDTTRNSTEILTGHYITSEWASFENSITENLRRILLIINEQFHPHTVAMYMPGAGASFQLRAHITKDPGFNARATVIPGEGFLGIYCKDGFPELILEDVGSRKIAHYDSKNGGVKSLMLAPVGAVKASAFLVVESTEKNAFSKENLDWLVGVGQIAGNLLYYAYLYKQFQLMHGKVHAIGVLEKRLLMIENREELLKELIRVMGELFSFTRCTLSFQNNEHDRFAVITKVVGEARGIVEGDRFMLNESSLAAMTLMTQQAFSRNFNGTTDYVFSENDHPRGLFASFASLPLGRSYGVIFLESDRPDTYGNNAMETLSRIVMVAGVALDKIKILEQQENLAIRDGLTGLYNHRQFQHLLREAIARSHRLMLTSVPDGADSSHYERREEKHPLSLVLCDIDHFKSLNDNHGHRFGDEVLRIIAQTLESGVREGVDHAARYGGEEFTLIMFGSDGEQAVETANRVREKIASIAFTTPTGSKITVTMSFGIAVYDKDATRQEDLIRKADKALYRAKDRGRNRVELYGTSGALTGQIPLIQS